MSRNVARVILLTAGFIWGFGFVVNKYILDSGWSDSQLLFVRFFTAAVVIFIVYRKRIIRTNKYTIYNGLFLGVFLYLGFYFQTWGLVHTTPSNNALITAGYIIMMPIIIFIAERTKVPKQTIFAGVVTLVGISLLTVDFKELSIGLGDSLTFIGAVFYAVHIYLLGKKSKEVDLFVLMAFQLFIFSVLAFGVMMISDGLPHVDFTIQNDVFVLILAIIIGFFGSFLAFLFQSIGQKHTKEAEAAILISSESLFGPIFGILFYNDPFNVLVVLGIFLVMSGIILSEIDLTIFHKDYKLK